MIGGALVLAVFAAIWAIVALVQIAAGWPMLMIPPTISLAIYLYARRRIGSQRRPVQDGRRVARLVFLWSAIEGVAILVAVNIAVSMNHPELVASAICMIVGLHFMPLARGIPQPSYYVTAAAMIVLAGAGLVLSSIVTAACVSIGAAVILWTTAANLISRS